MQTRNHTLMTILFALFLVSGATGLAYEILWTRLLIRVFGATSFAVTTVLASYMAGLALGSYLFGRIIDRRGNPARLYGLLELGIAVFAIAFPFVLVLLNHFYRSLYSGLQDNYYTLTAVRFTICFVILLIPTTFMGGTLPVLSKYVVRNLSHLTQRVGLLYAINTIGAVAGAFGTGFLLLPYLGIRHTTWLCAALNVAIFAIAFLIGRQPRGAPAVREAERGAVKQLKGAPARWDRLILTAFMFTGFFALSVEVIWTRVLTLVIGTTVYAFSVMLTTFLLGLAVGSAVFARLAQRTRRPGTVLGFLVVAIGVAVFFSSIAFGKLPVIYMHYYESQSAGWGSMVGLEFLLCFIIMLVPTFLMGGVFPLVARVYARDVSKVGGEIGTAYAFNTIGSIFGSIAGSFLFLRFLGVEKALIIISAGYVVISIVLLLTLAGYRSLKARTTVVVCIVGASSILFAQSPRWDRNMMTSGVYRYAPSYRTVEGLREAARWRDILFYDEGPGATVTVERAQDEVALVIDGKADASTGVPDMITQVLSAHLPLLFHPDPDTVLIVGLGSGVTLGSAERYALSHVDCVELLGNVVDAATYFEPYTYDCLSDPRANMVVGDGRNHVLLAGRTYDVIISQPPNPWISGVGDLFTYEFFEMMKRRLKPHGIAATWLHTYQMGDEDVRSTVKAYVTAFPHATLWMATESDVIFMGSESPFAFDRHLAMKMMDPGIASDLKRIWIDEVTDILSLMISGTEGLRHFARTAERMHTDDNMILEFFAARKVLQSTEHIHLANFLEMIEAVPTHELGREAAERVRVQTDARRMAIMGVIAEAQGSIAEAISSYNRAYALAPFDQFVLFKFIEGHLSLADALLQSGEYDRAAEHYSRSLADPDYPRAWRAYIGLANCSIAMRDYRSAHENLKLSLEKNPYNARGHYQLGRLELVRGNKAAARSAFERAIDLVPEFAEACNALARLYLEEGVKVAEALRLAEVALSVETTPDHLNTLAWAYHKLGERDKALRALKKALKLDPVNPETLYRLALAELAGGDDAEYRRLLEKLVSEDRDDEYTKKARSLLRAPQTR